MSVSNYTPQYSSNSGCSTYNYSKLENRVYLVSEEHVKDVHIDNGEAYIDSLTQAPTLIEGRNISFTEEETLDERYRFTKTLQITVDGYVTHNDLSGRFYAIIEALDGTLFMVNVDFPSKVTYEYTLNYDSNETVITFSSVSNFPTLRLSSSSILPSPTECKLYNLCGIRSLRLIESDYVIVDGNKLYMYGGNTFKDVWYLGKTLTFTETFDGEYVTNSVSFDIAFDAYKSSWHYNLLEFQQNTYVARMTTSCDGREVLAGHCFGLQPSYNIQTGDGSDTISVTMTSTGVCGLLMSTGSSTGGGFDETEDDTTRWVNVTKEGDYVGYVCLTDGMAMYVLQKELDGRGNPTGRYRAMKGYEHLFPGLNIVGTFTEESVFYETSCLFTDPSCYLDTDIPIMIGFSRPESRTYYIESNSDWFFGKVPDYITVTPMNGVAGTRYTVTVTNTLTPVNNTVEDGFYIHYCNSSIMVNVKVSDSFGLNPGNIDINCLSQTVCFAYDSDCPIEVISIDPRLSYQLTEGRLCVTVPMNDSVTDKVIWTIVVRDCAGVVSTATITQDKTYERWVESSDQKICVGRDSYTRMYRYTGVTASDANTYTGEYKAGKLIKKDDTGCINQLTKDEFSGNYYCIDGNKFEAIEQFVSYDEGHTWEKNGTTSLGKLVEANSDWCNLPVEYKWVLNMNKVGCEGDDIGLPDIEYLECSDVKGCDFFGKGKEYYVKSICTSFAFMGCEISEVSFPNLVEINGAGIFYNCNNLISIDLPKLTTCSGRSFTQINNIKKLELPNLETAENDGFIMSCNSLTEISLPKLTRVASIDNHSPVIQLCPSLEKLYIGGMKETYYRNMVDSESMSNLKEVRLDSLEIINTVGFFEKAKKLETVYLPNLKTINGIDTFSYCTSLVYLDLPRLETINTSGVFFNCTGLTKVNLPSLKSMNNTITFNGCKFTSLEFPSLSVMKFEIIGCELLETIVLGERTTSILNLNLKNCKSITGLYLLRRDDIVDTSNTDAYYNVKDKEDFFVYVPDNLFEKYYSSYDYRRVTGRLKKLSESPLYGNN